MKNIMNAFDDINKPDLICFSHLRWNFVFQRPQHLMTRIARERRVFSSKNLFLPLNRQLDCTFIRTVRISTLQHLISRMVVTRWS